MRYPAFLAALAIALCGADARAQAAPPAASDRIVLLVDEYKAIRNFPVILADRLGYLGDGRTVTVMNIRDDIPTAQMLIDGRVDAVMAYYHHNIVNRSEGRNLEAIVALGMTPGAKVLVANHARDKYKTPADLKGARIIAGGAGSSKTTTANALVMAGGNRIGSSWRPRPTALTTSRPAPRRSSPISPPSKARARAWARSCRLPPSTWRASA